MTVCSYLLSDSEEGKFRKRTLYDEGGERQIVLWKQLLPGGKNVEFLLDFLVKTDEEGGGCTIEFNSILEENLPDPAKTVFLRHTSNVVARPLMKRGKMTILPYDFGRSFFTLSCETSAQKQVSTKRSRAHRVTWSEGSPLLKSPKGKLKR